MAKSKFSKKQIAGTLLLSSTAIGATASGTASANLFTDFLKNGLGNLVNKAGNYAVSKIDKAGEILESGFNKIGDKVAGSKFSEYTGKIFGYTSDKASAAYNELKGSTAGKWIKNSKVDKFIGNNESTAYKHAWGAVAVGLLLVLGYGAYKVIKKVVNYYKDRPYNAYEKSRNEVLDKIRIFKQNLAENVAENLVNNKPYKNIKEALDITKKIYEKITSQEVIFYDGNDDNGNDNIDKIRKIIDESEIIDKKNKENLNKVLSELSNSYQNFSEKKQNYFDSLI